MRSSEPRAKGQHGPTDDDTRALSRRLFTSTRGPSSEKLKFWKRDKRMQRTCASKPAKVPHALDDSCMDRSGRLLASF